MPCLMNGNVFWTRVNFDSIKDANLKRRSIKNGYFTHLLLSTLRIWALVTFSNARNRSRVTWTERYFKPDST